MPLEVKFIEPYLIDKVVEFQNIAQSDTISEKYRQKKEFEWLFLNGPVRPAIYACAINSNNGDIIGTQAGIFIPMVNSEGHKITTLKGEDTLISLDRAAAIGVRDILNMLLLSVSKKSNEHNVDLIWGFTPARSAFKRCGFIIAGEILNSFYVIKPIRFFKNRVKTIKNISYGLKIKLLAFSIFNVIFNKFRLYRSSEFEIRKISIDDFNENLIKSFSPRGLFNIQLNRDYLEWRTINNPSPLKYEFFEALNCEKEVEAYLIMSHDSDNIWYVEHLLFSQSLTEHVKISIIRKVYDHAKSKGAIFIKAPGFIHNTANRQDMKLLSKAGSYFFKNQSESYFVFKNISDKNINPEEIYLSRLHTQGIR
jgi:hypothetical protein